MGEKLLTIQEVARYLNLSEEEIKELVDKHALPAYKIGGYFLRFKKEHVEAYRERQDPLHRPMGIDSHLNTLAKSNFIEDKTIESLRANRLEASRARDFRSYTFLERLENFLYYNDFYILSLILLILILIAIFKF